MVISMKKRKLSIEILDELATEMDVRVKRGEFKSAEEILEAALRYYLERHGQDAWSEYVREETETGLHESA